MPNNEKTNGIGTQIHSETDTAEEKITLESILKEYDAKKASLKSRETERASFEEKPSAHGWDEIEKELHGTAEEKDDFSDDSDMKIVGREVSAEETEEKDETPEPTAEHKRDIMSEISRHFEAQETRSETADFPEAEKEPIAVGKESAESEKTMEYTVADAQETENDSDATADETDDTEKHARHGRKAIDNEILRRAFQKDGYDLYTKKKKKERSETSSAESDGTERKTFSDADSSPKRSRRFDENGERIEGESRYFTPAFEYTTESDPEEQRGFLRRKLLTNCLSLAAVLILFFIGLYTELAPTLGFPHPKALEPGRFGRVYALFDLQILFFAVIIKLNSFLKGAAALSRKHTSSEAVAFVSVLAAALHTLFTVAFIPTQTGVSLLCSVAGFSMLLLSVSDFARARCEYMAFRIVSSEGEKVGFKDITASGEPTSDEIVKFVPEGSTVLDVRKTDFVDHFFARSCKPAPSDKGTRTMILISLIASVIGGILYYVFNKEPILALCGAVSVFMASVQTCALVSTVIPESAFADRAARRKCAFVGHDLCEEYDNVSVISFKDTEVFSPKDVKVTNIRTYGDTRIDTMIVTMARIFGKIGGPLSSVFMSSISGITLENDNVSIIDVAPDGLWMKADGDNVYIGTASYMAENNFEVLPENADISFRQTNGAILYLASSSRIMAKFYVKYTLSAGFESVLRSLYTQGICARIKTMDPCINNDFIRASLRRPECLFSVVKAQGPEEIDHEETTLSSGLVSASGEHSLIQSFLLVRRMKSVMRITGFFKIAAFVLGLFLSLLMLLGGSSVLSPIAVLLMQIFWLIPILTVTKLSVK